MLIWIWQLKKYIRWQIYYKDEVGAVSPATGTKRLHANHTIREVL